MVFIGILLASIIIFLAVRDRKEHNRVKAYEKFKAGIRWEFKRDYRVACAKYLPTPQDIAEYKQLFDNQQAQTAMGAMMANNTFAAGGEGFLAGYARVSSALAANKMQNKANSLYTILYYCGLIMQTFQSPTSETSDVVELSAELAYQINLALQNGALPYDVHSMNMMMSGGSNPMIPQT
jgi:hypothetical protein